MIAQRLTTVLGSALQNSGRLAAYKFEDAAGIVRERQATHAASSTLVLLDQLTIVVNEALPD